MADGEEAFEDAGLGDTASLVDAVFGAKRERESAEPDGDQETELDDAEETDETDEGDQTAEAEAVDGEIADTAEAKAVDGEIADTAEATAESAEADEDAPAGTEALQDAGTAPDASSASAAETGQPVAAPSKSRSPILTRGRLAAAAAVVVGVAAASVVLLSGGGSGNAAAPAASAPSTMPSVNPQAFYPVQSVSPFATGGTSELTDARIQAAVPGCDGCKLVTRANGFSPDGAVLALLRTGAPQSGKSNAKLVVLGGDGKVLWSAPDGFKALTAGIERFSVDAAGNFYLALPGAKYGQVLVVLAWHDGKVQDLGGLLDPKIKSDSIVGVLPQSPSGATATIVSQTTAGVPDADTGGLVESQYQIKDGAPVLTGCRRHVGESGQWLTFQPGADGCTHWPAGPAGPPDDDDGPSAPH